MSSEPPPSPHTSVPEVSLSKKEILDKIYYCLICKAVFLFDEDVKEHKTLLGHGEIKIISLE
jgi:hypothetical protein